MLKTNDMKWWGKMLSPQDPEEIIQKALDRYSSYTSANLDPELPQGEFCYSWGRSGGLNDKYKTCMTSIEVTIKRRTCAKMSIYHYDPHRWENAPLMALISNSRHQIIPYLFDVAPVFDHNTFITPAHQMIQQSMLELYDITDGFTQEIDWLPALGAESYSSPKNRVKVAIHDVAEERIYLFGDKSLSIPLHYESDLYLRHEGDTVYNLWVAHRTAQLLKINDYIMSEKSVSDLISEF